MLGYNQIFLTLNLFISKHFLLRKFHKIISLITRMYRYSDGHRKSTRRRNKDVIYHCTVLIRIYCRNFCECWVCMAHLVETWNNICLRSWPCCSFLHIYLLTFYCLLLWDEHRRLWYKFICSFRKIFYYIDVTHTHTSLYTWSLPYMHRNAYWHRSMNIFGIFFFGIWKKILNDISQTVRDIFFVLCNTVKFFNIKGKNIIWVGRWSDNW